MSSTYPREAVEYVVFGPVTATVAGVTTTFTDFKYVITTGSERPPRGEVSEGWLDPVAVDGKKAFLLDTPRPRGTYAVWVKVDAAPEHPVIPAGTFVID